MFNFFNKKKVNPISEIFNDLTTNQKMSIINLLLLIGVSDGKQGNPDEELRFLNIYRKFLNVRGDQCRNYLDSNGHKKIYEDLFSLSRTQKEFLIVASWEMIISDGMPNNTELDVASSLLERFGVPRSEFISTIENAQALSKQFLGN